MCMEVGSVRRHGLYGGRVVYMGLYGGGVCVEVRFVWRFGLYGSGICLEVGSVWMWDLYGVGSVWRCGLYEGGVCIEERSVSGLGMYGDGVCMKEGFVWRCGLYRGEDSNECKSWIWVYISSLVCRFKFRILPLYYHAPCCIQLGLHLYLHSRLMIL